MSTSTRNESALFIGLANALAGAAGGVSAMTLIYPLDVIRCRLQAQADALSKRPSIIQENDKRFSFQKIEMPTIDEPQLSQLSQLSPKNKRKMEQNVAKMDATMQQKMGDIEEVLTSIDRTIIDDTSRRRSSISNTISDIINEEGINGFYKALDTQLVGIFYSDIVYFFVVTFLKQYLYGQREVSPISNLKASTLAGVFNVLFTLPYWTVQTQLMLQKKLKNNKNKNENSAKNAKNAKNNANNGRNRGSNNDRNDSKNDGCGCCNISDESKTGSIEENYRNIESMESDEKSEKSEKSAKYVSFDDSSKRSSDGSNRDYKGFLDGLIQIYNKSGIMNGFYKGLGPSLALVSNPIIQFVSYEEMIKLLKLYQQQDQLSSLTYFVCGAIAKSLATIVTYPLQVMKTQLQKRDSKFNNWMECLQFLIDKLREGDIRPLYSGLAAKLWQTVLNSAIKYMIYERMLEIVLKALRRLRKLLFVAMLAKQPQKAVKAVK